MAGLTSLIADVLLFQVLKEIDLLPQLYEQYLVSHERVVISLPDRNYSRSLSFHLFKVISEFYCGFLHYTPSVRNCSFCLNATTEITCACQTILKKVLSNYWRLC